MATQANKPLERKYTKPMRLFWACLTREEEYQGKPCGRYAVSGAFENLEDTNEMLAMCEQEYEEFLTTSPKFEGFKPNKKVPPSFGEREDKEGNTYFKFTTQAYFTRKGSNEKQKKVVPVFDSQGKPYTGEIGNGSVGIVCFKVLPKTQSSTNYGTSLALEAIQILELKTGVGAGSQDASAFGFTTQAGGFVASDNEEELPEEFAFGPDNDDTDGQAQDGSQF